MTIIKPTRTTHLCTVTPGKGLLSRNSRIWNNFKQVEVMSKNRTLKQRIEFLFENLEKKATKVRKY